MPFPVLQGIKETLLNWAPQLNSINQDLRENRDQFIVNRVVPTNKIWVIDGVERRVFRKTFFVPELPNNATDTIPINTSFSFVTHLYGRADNGQFMVPIPYVNNSTLANCIQLYRDKDDLKLITQINFSSYSGHIFFEFLK